MLKKQHLIDPEICIRCNTCEETCTVGAVTHDDTNYVVDAEKCNYCMDCISPCPTGAIDNWRIVVAPYTLEQQFGFGELPLQEAFGGDAAAIEAMEAIEEEVAALLADAHRGTGGKPVAPPTAARPSINLFTRQRPAIATVQGNYRITAPDADSDVRHIVLSLGDTVFPVLEGQSVGVVVPGTRPDGRPHDIRLYTVASARDGEKPGANNLALTVKRAPGGIASNYLCDLAKGAAVELTGPFGATFLKPADPAADILMICTGTGSAPFRAFTERRRRAMPSAEGRLVMYFGARSPCELPYFGPLQKVPASILEQHLVYSRLPGQPKEHVQNRMRSHADRLAELLRRPATHVFICGLRGMETGVDEAFDDICCAHDIDWPSLKREMRTGGRYHVETY